MEEKSVIDALVLMKRTGNLLNEVEDLTKQIAESVDRSDRVSTEMLVAMREEPLEKLQAADQALREQLSEMTDRDAAAELAAMLNSGTPAQEGERTQQMLCDQVNLNRRRLQQVIELDSRVNRRISGEGPARP